MLRKSCAAGVTVSTRRLKCSDRGELDRAHPSARERMAAVSSEDDVKAAQMFLAGAHYGVIRAEVGLRDSRSVHAAILRGFRELGAGRTAAMVRISEMERCSVMLAGLFPKASRGDVQAVDKCLRVGERLERLSGEPDREAGMVAAFDSAVSELDVSGKDAALVASGRAIAQQIDYGTKYLLGSDVTKVLYLVPQLVSVLRELGATPAARGAVKAMAPDPKDGSAGGGGGLSELDRWRRDRKAGS